MPAFWSAIKSTMKFLYRTRNFKLTFSADGYRNITGYPDADWGADVDDRKSCTGYVFTLQGGAISWICKNQHNIALSNTEAEYMAISTACQDAIWLRQFDAELKLKLWSFTATIEVH